jgi:hypothetical protein
MQGQAGGDGRSAAVFFHFRLRTLRHQRVVACREGAVNELGAASDKKMTIVSA